LDATHDFGDDIYNPAVQVHIDTPQDDDSLWRAESTHASTASGRAC
jgi:hypothetical protein